jgi:hypothetical protein
VTSEAVSITESEVLDADDLSMEAWLSLSEELGWGDGLPTVPPTVELVDAFLAQARWLSGSLPSPIPPRLVRPTARSLLANLVMAGCSPKHIPAVVAALGAASEPKFNLLGILATTHPCTPMLVLGGPVRQLLDVNAGANCLGQGTRANAVIGRAVHLVLQNIGGATPGKGDRATHGTPGKYSYCFGENEEASPWEPYYRRLGYDKGSSVVVVAAAEAPHNINDHASSTGAELALTIAATISTAGNNNLLLGREHFLVLGPEHANTFADDGWSVRMIQEAVFELSMIPVERITPANQREIANWGRQPVDGKYPIGSTPDDIQVLVAGGAGKHSLWIPTFGGSQASSRRIEHLGDAGRTNVTAQKILVVDT